MASGTSILSEDQFLCPICLDMFTRPVSTPCGHNFCMSCITAYWNGTALCQCPLCKETFERRPHLKVNTFISELASQFVLLQVTDAHARNAEQQLVNSDSAVLCDICADTQQEAVRSCLECLTSYCDIHLEPHYRAAGLKRHTLVNPANLEARVCEEHNHLLRLFCRQDKVLLCDVCCSLRHLNHHVVPLQQAYDEMKDVLEDTDGKAKQMIQERQQKVQATKNFVHQSKKDTEAVIVQSTQDLTALLSEIQKSQAKLEKLLEEKQKASEEQAEGFISCMERDVDHLQKTRRKLRELEQSKDQLRFLQELPNACVLPQTTDLSSFIFHRHVRMHHMRRSLSSSVSQLQVLLNNINAQMNKFSGGADESDGATLTFVQQHEVDVVLDSFTAHPLLILSENRKEVRYSLGSALWGNHNLNRSTFTEHLAVLGEQGFMSCRFYFEVFVGVKTEWCLGVAKASVQRKGGFARSPDCGLWALWFLGDRFETFSCPNVPVHWGKVERVGVFVDYDEGQVLFYDVQTRTLIYSFTECFFTEALHPYFNPCDNEYGSNLDPMVIVPVVREFLS